MIPVELQNFLVKETKNLFKGLKLKNTNGVLSPLNVYAQYLPYGTSQDAANPFPYIRVILVDGEDPSISESNHCRIIFLAGVYDDDPNNQGYWDALSIVQKLYTHLMRHIIFDGKYEIARPVKWSMIGEELENTWPYFFGAIETNWNVGKITIADTIT